MAKMSDSPRRKLFRPVPGQMDMVFFLITMLLLVIGLIMLFSASYANAYYLLGNSFHYISRQLLFAVPGVIAMYVISRIDYHIFHRLAYPADGGFPGDAGDRILHAGTQQCPPVDLHR